MTTAEKYEIKTIQAYEVKVQSEGMPAKELSGGKFFKSLDEAHSALSAYIHNPRFYERLNSDTPKKHIGRPKGSKNKPKVENHEAKETAPVGANEGSY